MAVLRTWILEFVPQTGYPVHLGWYRTYADAKQALDAHQHSLRDAEVTESPTLTDASGGCQFLTADGEYWIKAASRHF